MGGHESARITEISISTLSTTKIDNLLMNHEIP